MAKVQFECSFEQSAVAPRAVSEILNLGKCTVEELSGNRLLISFPRLAAQEVRQMRALISNLGLSINTEHILLSQSDYTGIWLGRILEGLRHEDGQFLRSALGKFVIDHDANKAEVAHELNQIIAACQWIIENINEENAFRSARRHPSARIRELLCYLYRGNSPVPLIKIKAKKLKYHADRARQKIDSLQEEKDYTICETSDNVVDFPIRRN